VKQKITFELCAETLQGCLAARDGGADRIELCSALSEDGLTPSHGLIRAAVEHSGLPVHVLLRPRGGNFVYTADEFVTICDDLLHARELGVSGFALGVLHVNGTVDAERTRELVARAAPLQVTFHRAFDLTPLLDEALEAIIAVGCHRILTSGGEPDVVMGAANLARLVKLAGDRIDIAAGGGLRLSNAASVAHNTQARHFHGSVRRKMSHAAKPSPERAHIFQDIEYMVDPDDVSAMIEALNGSLHDETGTNLQRLDK
jgi:copper homeostasis protein